MGGRDRRRKREGEKNIVATFSSLVRLGCPGKKCPVESLLLLYRLRLLGKMEERRLVIGICPTN